MNMDGDSFMSNMSSTSSAASNRTNVGKSKEPTKPLTIQEKTKIQREFEKNKNFRHIPSKGVVIIKWVATIVLGSLLLGCVTDSKISILSLSEQMAREKKDRYKLFVMLQLMAMIPHAINFIRGVMAGGFRRDIPWPRPRALIGAVVVSLLEATGLCLFIFMLPGLFKPSNVVLLMSCVFVFPTLVNLVTAFRVQTTGSQRPALIWRCMFLFALLLEVVGIGLTLYVVKGGARDKLWAFLGVGLLSFCWIPKVQQFLLQTKEQAEYQLPPEVDVVENGDQFQNTGRTGSSNTGYQTISEEQSEFGHGSIQLTDRPGVSRNDVATNPDNRIRFESQPWKLTIFMSFWKALFTFIISLLLFHFVLFENRPSMSEYRDGWSWTGTTSNQVYYFVANIATSITGYIVGYIACTTCMQRWAFSLPLFLATPLAIVLTTVSSSCKSLFDPDLNSDICDIDEKDDSTNLVMLILSAALLVLAQGISIGWLLFRSQSIVMLKEGQLFWVPMYNPVLLEQWLMLTRRNEHNDEDHEDPIVKAKRSRIIICTTMYREADYEMKQLLESIQGVNIAQSEYERHFESHIFFDGAVKDRNPTEFVLQLVSLVESTLDVKAKNCTKTVTPYGMSLSWRLNAEPGRSGMIFKIHLKDNFKVKNKKRWSQVMYMSYVLDFLMSQMDNATLEETYILTTDADVRFTPDSVEALLDLMTRDRSVGAVCARTHPLGSGPMVWYQVFEYAIGHWFQKAAEHVLGSVLCSPGCFSVYRCKALRDILPKYASNVEHAFDFLTKDMGEDRWLCTLMVQSGWRIEYCAASENSTHCPEEFDEFYKQRRRWVVSTLANLMLLIKEWNIIAKLNHRVNFMFMIYQASLLFATLIGPSSVILIVSGGLAYGWDIQSTTTVVLQVLICLAYVLTCLFTSSKTQLSVAKLLTFAYAIIMTATIVGTAVQVVSDYIEDDSGDVTTVAPSPVPPTNKTTKPDVLRIIQTTFPTNIVWAGDQKLTQQLQDSKLISESFPMSTTSFYLALMIGLFMITGILHLGEIVYLLHGIWYLLFLPSGYLILMIYSICNITDRSWGTREAKTSSVVSGKQTWHQILVYYFKSIFFCCFEQKPEVKTISVQTESFRPCAGSLSALVSETVEPSGASADPDASDRKPLYESRMSIDGSVTRHPAASLMKDESDEEDIDENQIIPVRDWLPRDLKHDYASKFIDNGFENTMLIASMTEKELKGIGIKGKGARRLLMEEIKRLPDYEILADVPENVEDWLNLIGLIQYKSHFYREQIRTSRDMEILKSFGRTEIEKELKITKVGHVKRLMYAIRKLRNPTEFERKIMAVKRSIEVATTHNLKKVNMTEHDFWEKLKGLCLSPQATAYGLDDDLHVKLGELRNLWLIFFAVSNFLWLILIMTLANKGELLSVLNSNPVGLVVLVMFSIVLVIQFFAMLVHRVTTLTHFLGRAPYRVGDTYNTSWAFNDNDILRNYRQRFGEDDFEALIARQRTREHAQKRLNQPRVNRSAKEERRPLLGATGRTEPI